MFLISAHVTTHLLFTSTSVRTCFLSVFTWLSIFALPLPLLVCMGNYSLNVAIHIWLTSTSISTCDRLLLLFFGLSLYLIVDVAIQSSCSNSSLIYFYLC